MACATCDDRPCHTCNGSGMTPEFHFGFNPPEWLTCLDCMAEGCPECGRWGPVGSDK